jgi:CheY-like chemotaxis protein
LGTLSDRHGRSSIESGTDLVASQVRTCGDTRLGYSEPVVTEKATPQTRQERRRPWTDDPLPSLGMPLAEREGSPTILIVEDDVDFSEVLKILLEMEGYCVRTARNGSEALSRIDETCPDLVLCDLMMPVMDGLELLNKMRQKSEFSRLPFVMMSAAPESIARYAPPATFLKKPLDLEEVVRAIEAALGSPRPEEEPASAEGATRTETGEGDGGQGSSTKP